jgi:hypothetical protein
VSSADVDDFLRESLCDNKLAALELESDQNLSVQTVIQLAGEAQALYVLLSLQGRSFEPMKQHRVLWQKGAQFFEDAIAIWQSVPSNGELLDAHRQLLAELSKLARDRVEFYTLTDERRDYRRRKLD